MFLTVRNNRWTDQRDIFIKAVCSGFIRKCYIVISTKFAKSSNQVIIGLRKRCRCRLSGSYFIYTSLEKIQVELKIWRFYTVSLKHVEVMRFINSPKKLQFKTCRASYKYCMTRQFLASFRVFAACFFTFLFIWATFAHDRWRPCECQNFIHGRLRLNKGWTS